VLSRRLLEVQETERRHLARELHDEVGQMLTGLKLLLKPHTLPSPDPPLYLPPASGGYRGGRAGWGLANGCRQIQVRSGATHRR
jgi:hypothetical protein